MNEQPGLSSRRAQRGFTLVEALVALVVMAFGMLAVAGFQITMSRNSDVAKQRSEAVRLGQLKIEELRSFQSTIDDGKTVADAGNIFDYVSDVIPGSCTVPTTCAGLSAYGTNTEYSLQWTLQKKDGVTAATGTDLEKWISMVVSWTDRTGESQSVMLRSVIARSDPINFGELFAGKAAGKHRTPKNRHIDIPYPSVSLGGGKSGFIPPGAASQFYVFDDISGDVEKLCTGTPSFGVDTSSCANLCPSGSTTDSTCKAYLLTGYVRFLDSLPSGNERNVDNGITNPTTATRELSLSIDSSVTSGTPFNTTCFSQRQKGVSVGNITVINISGASRSAGVSTITTSSSHNYVVGQRVSVNNVTGGGFDGEFTVASVPNGSTFTYSQSGVADGSATSTSGATTSLIQEVTIPDDGTAAPPGYSTVTSRFVAYACIVTPADDGNATTRNKWSGQAVITPQPTAGVSWSLGTSDGTFKVCRFTGDYRGDNQMSNSEHPLYYRAVTQTMDNQNYLVLPHNVQCPNDDEAAPLNSDYVNTQAILHQNTSIGTSPYGGSLSTGAQWGGGGAGEPSDPAVELPMF